MGATGVWALLMAGGLVVLALLGLAVLADHTRTPRPDLARLRAEADELAAHAARARLTAARVAQEAVLARAGVAVAEQARDAAWTAQETIEQAARVAEVAAEALIDEAAESAAEADEGRCWPCSGTPPAAACAVLPRLSPPCDGVGWRPGCSRAGEALG